MFKAGRTVLMPVLINPVLEPSMVAHTHSPSSWKERRKFSTSCRTSWLHGACTPCQSKSCSRRSRVNRVTEAVTVLFVLLGGHSWGLVSEDCPISSSSSSSHVSLLNRAKRCFICLHLFLTRAKRNHKHSKKQINVGQSEICLAHNKCRCTGYGGAHLQHSHIEG